MPQITDIEARVAMVVQQGVEAYKSFKECLNKKIEYSTKTCLVEKSEVQTKVAIRFLNLDLKFLDKESEAKEDDPAPEAEVVVNPLASTI